MEIISISINLQYYSFKLKYIFSHSVTSHFQYFFYCLKCVYTVRDYKLKWTTMINCILLYKHQCFTGISAKCWEKPYIFTSKNTIFLRVKISANHTSSFVALFSCFGMDNSIYIINRIIHGRLEIWNLSSSAHIRYLTLLLCSLVRYQCEHSKINSISPCAHVLFSI